MTTINDTGVEALRARVGSTLAGRLGAHIERLDWDAGKLERFQRDEVRRLLAHAVERLTAVVEARVGTHCPMRSSARSKILMP